MSRRLSPLIPRLSIVSFACLALLGCNEATRSGPNAVCPDPSVVEKPSAAKPSHTPKKVTGRALDSLAGIRFASKDSVDAFFGGKKIKVAFVLDRSLYLVEWGASGAILTDLTSGDEAYAGGPGNINSPLFSPEGAWLAYGGALSTPAVSFVRQALSGPAPAWRLPVDTSGQNAFDPHWVADTAATARPPRMWIYFATNPGPVAWSDRCAQMGGSTYRAEAGFFQLRDPALGMGPVEATGLPGSFKGGLSKSLVWAGTSYGPSALHDRQAGKTTLLAGLVQQCNPSMNPFPPGSPNEDYMMILGFGGSMQTVAGDVVENVHENLWIYGKEDRIVWRGRLPPDAKYKQWQKPEWSTHPAYATSVALHGFNGGIAEKGDLYAVRIGDLAGKDRTVLSEAEAHFKLAEGRFTESSFSHLWVEP